MLFHLNYETSLYSYTVVRCTASNSRDFRIFVTVVAREKSPVGPQAGSPPQAAAAAIMVTTSVEITDNIGPGSGAVNVFDLILLNKSQQRIHDGYS